MKDDISGITMHIFDWLRSFPWVGTLFAMMALDMITGFAAAFVTKSVNSSITRIGVTRKALVWVLISVTWLLQRAGAYFMKDGYNIPTTDIVAMYYLVSEALSVLENIGIAGVPLPPFLIDALVKIKQIKSGEYKIPGDPNQPLIVRETVERQTIIEKDPGTGTKVTTDIVRTSPTGESGGG